MSTKLFKFFAIVFLLTQATSCYVFRAVKNRKFELKDLENLESIKLPPSPTPFYFTNGLNKNSKLSTFLDSSLKDTYTYSFLVIKNDTIIYEKYFDELFPVNNTTKQPSFSVAKTFIGTLVQMAVQDGFIKSLNEPITNYLPYLKQRDEAFESISIQHVMNMASGIKSNENYGNPFSDVLHLGFTKNLNKQLKKLKIESKPGGKSDYKSVNTQLLASILEAATKQKAQDYFIQKIWNPLGMENEASWNIDSKKNTTIRAFCCLNASTKDFAKLGKLYLNYGKYNGNQLLDSTYIVETTLADSMAKNDGYKNQIWAGNPSIYFTDSIKAVEYSAKTPFTKPYVQVFKEKKYFGVYHQRAPYYANGILEQYIYVNPTNNTIIVRLGHYWNHKKYSCLRMIEAASTLAN